MQAKITEYANMTQQTAAEDSFQETEIGLIPKDWEVVRLGDLFDLQQGKAMSPKARLGISPHPFLRTVNVLWGRIDLSTLDYMDFTQEEITRLRLQLGDLLVCEGGEIGRTAMWREEVEVCGYQNHIHRLRKRREDMHPEFYMYWMQAAFLILGLYVGEAIRTAIPNLSGGRLKSFIVPKPPLPEQRKIAKVLGTIQRAVEQQDKIIEAAKNLKKSLMQKLFTEGLRGEEQKETEIGLIPKSWKVMKVGDVSVFKNGVNFTKDQKGNTGILTIDVLNMYGEGLCVNLQNLYRVNKEINDDYLLKDGDILFVRSSLKREGVGWASLYKKTNEPVTFCGFIIRARLKSDDISPEFLTNFLRTTIAREKLIASSGKVAITNINQGMLGQLGIPIPPLPEQQKIAHILSTVDRKIEVEKKKKATFSELFKTMLHKLMTGEIRLKDVEV